ncbi:hypothetical protein WN944_019594 [Citrus x changshan-huyou]|uniref:Uncharacterized protein n=1 Tax=Citrus x changshan-huyou TaxID=2935761 RepID=A0AAP0QGI6_9ROSI
MDGDNAVGHSFYFIFRNNLNIYLHLSIPSLAQVVHVFVYMMTLHVTFQLGVHSLFPSCRLFIRRMGTYFSVQLIRKQQHLSRVNNISFHFTIFFLCAEQL